MMKRGIIAVVITALGLIGLSSCGGSATKSDLTIKVNVISKSADPTPKWVNKKWEIGRDATGKKVIYFTVIGEAPTKEKAEIKAEAKKRAVLASYIKELTTREFAVAKQGMLNDETDLDTYFEETIASVSRNVNTSGAMNIEDYWEYIQEIQGGNSKTYYRYAKRYVIDYNQIQKAIQEAWKPVAKKVPPELKNKAQKLIDQLTSADETKTGY